MKKIQVRMINKDRTKAYKVFKPVLTERQYLNAEENYQGFCIACGNDQDNCEPDARKYVCEACEKPCVYGIPELLIMGFIELKQRVEYHKGE